MARKEVKSQCLLMGCYNLKLVWCTRHVFWHSLLPFWLTRLKMCCRQSLCSSWGCSSTGWSPTCALCQWVWGGHGPWLTVVIYISELKMREKDEGRARQVKGGRQTEQGRRSQKERAWHARDGIKWVLFSAGCHSVRHSVHHGVGPLDWSRSLVSPNVLWIICKLTRTQSICLEKRRFGGGSHICLT